MEDLQKKKIVFNKKACDCSYSYTKIYFVLYLFEKYKKYIKYF